MLTLKKTNHAIGLDISDLALKAAELKMGRDKIKIGAVSKYNLKPGIIEEGVILNEEEALKAIKTLIAKTKYGSFNSNEIVASLPDPKTFIKLIEIDKTPNELSRVIGAEIEKYVPLPLKDLYYDWQVVRENRDTYQILIGAAPKKIVDQYTQIINRSGLSLLALEIEPISIARALLEEESKKYKGGKEKNYCMIDIGAKRTSLTIYSKYTIATSVSLPMSSDETTEIIAQALEISKDEAEKAKIICGLDKSQAHGIVSDILTEMLETLTRKIEATIDFFYKHYPENGPINEIILCGGGANIKNLDTNINEKLNIPVHLGNPLVNTNEDKEMLEKHLVEKHSLKIKGGNSMSIEQNSIISFTTAIGLALRSAFIDKL